MAELALTLQKRELSGRHARKLRQAGVIPSVVYGGKTKAISTQSPFVETTKIVQLAGKHTPVHVVIDDKKKLAIIKRVDVDPVKHKVRHVSFQTIKQNEKITTEVPIVLVGQGESEAEKLGLVILQALDKIEIKALPAKLPESLELSVVGLVTTDDKLVVSDLVLPEGVDLVTVDGDADQVIANVYEPSALQAANEAAAGDAEDESEVEAENGVSETNEEALTDNGKKD